MIIDCRSGKLRRKKNQRPCNIFERIPSCNKGLYEDFKKGRCLSKVVPGRDCGRKNQRPCMVWERIPSCNGGLYEDFKKGRCLSKAVPGRDCGRKNQRACKVWERIPSCNAGLVEDLKRGWCVAKAISGKDCGNANQRPCTIVERIPSCNKGLVEHLPTNRCTSLADLGNKFQCGKRYQKPCKILERIPSCDDGLVEDFLKGKCVPSEDAERHRIAEKKLKQIGEFVHSKVGFATNVADNPQVRNSLNSQDKTSVARVVNTSEVGEKQMPDGHLLRTLTVGATAGVKIFIGTSGGAGASIDLKGERPAYAYATGDISLSLGVTAGGGIDVGFWVCQNNKIGGDSWGVEFGVYDIALALAKKVSVKGGPSLGIGLWFNYSKPPVFQGFTITPEFGIGADFGGVVKAATAVENDPDVECDGRPTVSSSRRPNAAVPKLGSKLGAKPSHSKSGSNLGTTSTSGTTTTTSSFPPPIVSLTPGARFTTSTVTFTGAHTSVDVLHSLWVGTTSVGSDLHRGPMTNHRQTVSGLPTTGTIYVRYWSTNGGDPSNSNSWFLKDQIYTMNVK